MAAPPRLSPRATSTGRRRPGPGRCTATSSPGTREIGGHDHALGLPIAAPANAAGPGATVQRFRVGRMFWSAATATREVYGRIYTAYYNAGLDSGRLGLPNSYQTATPSGAQQTCEAGRIEWNSATNATTVIYN